MIPSLYVGGGNADRIGRTSTKTSDKCNRECQDDDCYWTWKQGSSSHQWKGLNLDVAWNI